MSDVVRRMLGESVWDPPKGMVQCPACEAMGYVDEEGNPHGPDTPGAEPCYLCHGKRFVKPEVAKDHEDRTKAKMREYGMESRDEVRAVIEDTRPVKFYRCPHCNEEIFEKHDYVDESGVTRHRGCGGAFKWPPPSPEQKAWLDKLLSR